MAPVMVEQIDDHLRDVIHNLYSLMIQAADHRGQATSHAMQNEVIRLVSNLQTLTQLTSSSNFPVRIPDDIISYVESGRNPDIFTREFVEIVQANNQRLKGRTQAFAQLRDCLAEEITAAIPEIRETVALVGKRDKYALIRIKRVMNIGSPGCIIFKMAR